MIPGDCDYLDSCTEARRGTASVGAVADEA